MVPTADFGVSEQLSSAASTSNKMIGTRSWSLVQLMTTGTPLWMAPEVILKQKYDNRVGTKNWNLLSKCCFSVTFGLLE